MTVRTRIPPSPTGEDLHIGNLYTALINWTWAKKNNGQFIVRIEDTDRAREVAGSEEKILSALKRFGLEYDEGPDKIGTYSPYRQSERLDLYKKYAEQLIEQKSAYYCICSKERLAELREAQIKNKQVPRYDKHCLNLKLQTSDVQKKDHIIRLNVPENETVLIPDLIHGEIKFNTNDLDDQVLIKSDGYPTYHLANVVDDHLMKITHVIRGEEWISSTPKHILLYKAFEWELPQFAHTPLLRNPDRSKLSKRRHPVWVSWYLDQGYLPEAILNYLSLMGWSHPDQKEIFDLEEYVRVFDLKDVDTVGPVFDVVKLEWMNGEYIRKMKIEDLQQKIEEFIGDKYDKEIVAKTIPLVQERIKKFSDYVPLCEFFFKPPKQYDVNLADQKDLLQKISKELERVEEWTADKIGEVMVALADQEGIKHGLFFMALRVAVTGRKISPPLNESMEILGKEECVDRIKKLI